MKKLLSIIAISILVFSCSNKSGTGPIDNAVSKTGGKVLKINTQFYNTSIIADHLVSISVSNSGGYTDYPMNTLTNGIRIINGSTIGIKVADVNGKDYSNNILWTGYSFSSRDEATNKEIEVVMDRDISLSLITTDNATNDISIKSLLLTIGAPEEFINTGIKVNGSLFATGAYDLFFATNQKVDLEAITTTNENIIFLGFKTTGGNNTNLTTNFIMEKDTTVQADFADKRSYNILVTILGISKENGGTLYVNDVAVPESGQQLANQRAGTIIRLRAEPKNASVQFMSWNDNITGYLSDKQEYEYVVGNSDAVINSVLSAAQGVVTVSVSPRTNYFTTIGTNSVFHTNNEIKYIVRDEDNQIIKESGVAGVKHLNWEENTIMGLAAGFKVELEAIPGDGFYPNKDHPNAVEWTGAAEGRGFNQEITMGNDGASKAVNVKFEIEKRQVIVKLDPSKQINPADKNWISEDSKEDARGYTITINETKYPGVKTASAIFDWHTKVDIKIDGGKNYEATNTISQDGDIGSWNPEKEPGYNEDPTTARINTLTFDLENESSAVTAQLHHRKVEMILSVIGGKFDNSGEIATNYNGFINIKGTGYPSEDKMYNTGEYYDGVNTSSGGSTDVPAAHNLYVLSGVPVNIYANPNTSTLFRNHKYNLISDGTGTDTIINSTNVTVTNRGDRFTLQSTFYAPIWTLEVDTKGYVEEDNGNRFLEPADYNTADYSYEIKPLGGSASLIESVMKTFRITNGLPVNIRAIEKSGGHYTFHSMAGASASQRDVISTNHSVVQINFTHNQKTMKLNIIGGRDDRNQSYVRVSGSGVPQYDRVYFASNRNISNRSTAPSNTYNLKVLSGIQNKVKIEAVTSMVHNFDNIDSRDVIPLTPVGTIKRGIDTFNSTNSYTIDMVPSSSDAFAIDVKFRINSYDGALNGSDDGVFKNAQAGDAELNITNITDEGGIRTYNIYTARQLSIVSKMINYDFDREKIKLVNDVYFGNDSGFTGFEKEFKGAFEGRGKTSRGVVIYDLAIRGRALFHNIKGASISYLATGRGSIGTERNGYNIGLIGESIDSTIKYVTNSSSIGFAGNNDQYNTGGVVGRLMGGGTAVSYVGNYGNVEGYQNVGGVIGILEGGAGYNNKFMFNRGNVKGNDRVGGVLGRMEVANRVYQVYNSGNVEGFKEGVKYVGGIIGVMGWARNGRSGDTLIESFYNTGAVSGGSGVAGVIIGCREIMDGGGTDKPLSTDALRDGYSIGNYDKENGASLVTYSGFRGDGGDQKVYIYDVYGYGRDSLPVNPLKSGLRYDTDLEWRIDGGNVNEGGRKSSIVYFQYNDITIAGNEGNVGNLIKSFVTPSGENGYKSLNTSLQGFANGSIWVQANGLRSVNGFTSRPVLKDLPEEYAPKHMTNYDAYVD